MSRLRRLTSIAGLVSLQSLSCGGGGTPPDDAAPNPCPTGDCTLPGNTVVKYLFDSYPEWRFVGDTCIDLGVFFVRADAVHVANPELTASKQVQCGEQQVTFVGLDPGTYDVRITPLDFDGNPVVHAPGVGQAIAADPGMRTEITVNVPYTAWIATFTGTLLFRLAWNGKTCAEATPAVATQTLQLTIGGNVVPNISDTGQKLDGTDPRPCRALTEQFAQFALDLPFGPAKMYVVGRDAAGGMAFEHHFDTFIGAGKNNPTITYDVPPPVDGGIDAGIDAPAVDAPMVDAPATPDAPPPPDAR